MTRPLPPLNALRAFEAAARHLSFKSAAEELNVTPAAVSHQVKALEDLLGVPLFHRMTRALRLTEAGQAALPALTEGFDKLVEAAKRIRAYSDSGVLTISVSPSFGSIWLVPRLERFRRRHPDIEIRIDGTDRLADVASGEVDVALRYGPGNYKGVQVDFLFNQFNNPVCSPLFWKGTMLCCAPKIFDTTLSCILNGKTRTPAGACGLWRRVCMTLSRPEVHTSRKKDGRTSRTRWSRCCLDRGQVGGRSCRGATCLSSPGPQDTTEILLLPGRQK